MKPLLTADELIAHMENKGITFTIQDKDFARNFLQNHNYYMKLASYRKNYSTYDSGPQKGKYINLEFAYLRELSIIDRDLRYQVIHMALDIEHYLKVNLLKDIENNPHEDGYSLVKNFIEQDNNSKYLDKINKHKSSDYCKDLIKKYEPDFPAWVFVELISFSDLVHLYAFYNKKYNINDKAQRVMLNSVKDIRNASAHSNCLINRLTAGENRPDNSIVMRVKEITEIKKNARDKKLSNKVVYDFVCLLFAYDEIVPAGAAKKERYKQLNELFSCRMIQNKEWFMKENMITSTYEFCKKIVDRITMNQGDIIL